MNSLSNILKKTGHDIFESIMQVLAISLLSFLIISPAIFIFTVPVAVVYLLLTAVPSLTGSFYAIKYRLVDRRNFRYRSFFIGFKKYYFSAVLYGLLIVVFCFIPFASWWYYIKVKSILSFVIAIFQSYFFTLIALSQVFTLPVMICESKGIIESTKTSLKLFLDNAAYTVGALIQITCVSSLLIITVISVPLLFSGMLSIFLINIYNNLLLKYEEQQEAEAVRS